MLDTGDYYGAGHHELLIGRALRDRRDHALVSLKFGALRGPDSWIGMDTRPAATKNFLAYSLTRLGLDHVDIYRPGRLDPNVPIEDTIGGGVTACGVLSRGLLSSSQPKSRADFGAYLPRFTGENRERNQRLVEALQKLAADKGVTASQLAIAWVLAKGTTIVPLIGARTRAQLAEALGALQVTLTAEDIARIETALPAAAVAGTRYDEHQMRILDSERA